MSAVKCGISSEPTTTTTTTTTTKLRAAWLVFVLSILRDVSGSPLTSTPNASPKRNETLKPYFDDVSRREIEAIEGQTLLIPCTVRNLSKDKVVSWIRTRDLHILTSGRHAFSSDFRFEALHTDSSGDFWGLRIRGVKPEDSGQYECQVNTDPKMSLAVQLTVTVPGSPGQSDLSKWLGRAEIDGPREIFVQNGSPFSLVCKIQPVLDHQALLITPKADVWWLHDDIQISSNDKVSIETLYDEEGGGAIHSRLSFVGIAWQDGGTYACLKPSVKKDSVRIIVVEAESSEAMQRDYPAPSQSTAPSLCLGKYNTALFIAAYILFW